MPEQALHDWPAARLLAAFARRELSPVEVTQSVLEHVARWEPQLHASYLLRPELALSQARASEARWIRGEPCGTLDGVPVTLKENIATQGDPMPLGTAATELVPASADAPRRRGYARLARCWFARPPCRTTACCPPVCRAFTPPAATRGT